MNNYDSTPNENSFDQFALETTNAAPSTLAAVIGEYAKELAIERDTDEVASNSALESEDLEEDKSIPQWIARMQCEERHNSICRGMMWLGVFLFLAQGFMLTGGYLQLQSYQRWAQADLQKALKAQTPEIAQQNLPAATGWFEMEGRNLMPPTEVRMAFAQVESLSTLLRNDQSTSLSPDAVEAIAEVAKTIDEGYQDVLTDQLDSFVVLLGAIGAGFYFGLQFASSKAQLQQNRHQADFAEAANKNE